MKMKLLIACLISISLVSAQNKTETLPPASSWDVAPPSWYIGMADSSLQVIIHASGIGAYDLSISYPGVHVIAISQVENPNYLFVDLVIDDQAQPGNIPFVFTSGKKSFTYAYPLLERKKRTFAYGLDAGDMIYLLMPDRFSNGDTANDIMPGTQERTVNRKDPKGRHGGDIQGMINHLDYISKLGATAIWCTPLIENDQPKWSYHGYAATDHYKIDPRYGTNEQYALFVQEAHKRDLKVVVDIVHNHIGSGHWLFEDLPMQDWIHRLDSGFVRSNYRTSVKNDPYASEYDYRRMNEGWFDFHMPDLNQDNPYLSKYIIQNNIWWIETYEVDGFRLDTYPYSDLKFLQDWALAINRQYPGFGVFGEVWVNGVGVQGYFHGDNAIDDGYNSYLPGVTDFTLYDALTTGLNEQFGWYEGMRRLYHTLTQDYVYGDVMKNVVFLSNHDISRFYSLVNTNTDKFKMAITFAMTTRGMIQWYYGDEIGMKNFVSPEDGKVREDFPGGWAGDSINKFERSNLTAEEKEIFDYVTGLANWRKNSDAIAHGKLMQFIPENGVYVYFRYTEKETVMVILNTNDKEYTLENKRMAERLNGFTTATLVPGKSTVKLESLKVGAKQSAVYILK